MNFIEYVQRAFVFCGAIVIVVVAYRWIQVQIRRIRLHRMAMHLLDPQITARHIRAEISSHEIEAFLSLVSTSDISNDVFLKEVVEDFLTRDLPGRESGNTNVNVNPSPSPANE